MFSYEWECAQTALCPSSVQELKAEGARGGSSLIDELRAEQVSEPVCGPHLQYNTLTFSDCL